MIKALDRNYRDKLCRLLSVMLPIICTQIAILGMNFFDASMSGQAGDVDLAGAAIGGNIWMPIQTGISGILMAAMPLVANLLGAGEKEKITVVVRHGLCLALGFAVLVLACGTAFLPHFLQGMGLAPEVYHVALWYLAGLGLGVIPFFMIGGHLGLYSFDDAHLSFGPAHQCLSQLCVDFWQAGSASTRRHWRGRGFRTYLLAAFGDFCLGH